MESKKEDWNIERNLLQLGVTRVGQKKKIAGEDHGLKEREENEVCVLKKIHYYQISNCVNETEELYWLHEKERRTGGWLKKLLFCYDDVHKRFENYNDDSNGGKIF